jgi:hypothetical protein
MSRKLRRYAIILTVFSSILAACGGGGSGDDFNQREVLTSTSVVFDTALPDWVNDSIVKVVSPSGQRSSNLEMPAYTGGSSGEFFALAVDVDDNIVLASTVDSESTLLSSASTALVLVRLAIGPVPEGISATQLNTIIQAAEEYPNLVGLIAQAINDGVVPTLHLPVLASVSQITAEIESQVSDALAAVTGPTAIGVIAAPRVSKPVSMISLGAAGKARRKASS